MVSPPSGVRQNIHWWAKGKETFCSSRVFRAAQSWDHLRSTISFCASEKQVGQSSFGPWALRCFGAYHRSPQGAIPGWQSVAEGITLAADKVGCYS